MNSYKDFFPNSDMKYNNFMKEYFYNNHDEIKLLMERESQFMGFSKIK